MKAFVQESSHAQYVNGLFLDWGILEWCDNLLFLTEWNWIPLFAVGRMIMGLLFNYSNGVDKIWVSIAVALCIMESVWLVDSLRKVN